MGCLCFLILISPPPPCSSASSHQIIENKNEALLAVLTETLDDIQEDDMVAFRNMDKGDMAINSCTSPTVSPKPAAPVSRWPPLAPEVDELSLVRTHFLLFKVDLDAPLISRLHGYDRKKRSEFFSL